MAETIYWQGIFIGGPADGRLVPGEACDGRQWYRVCEFAGDGLRPFAAGSNADDFSVVTVDYKLSRWRRGPNAVRDHAFFVLGEIEDAELKARVEAYLGK